MTELERILIEELKTYKAQFRDLVTELEERESLHKQESASLRELVQGLIKELNQNDYAMKKTMDDLAIRDLKQEKYWRLVIKTSEQLGELEKDLEVVVKGQSESEQTLKNLLKSTNVLLGQLQIE